MTFKMARRDDPQHVRFGELNVGEAFRYAEIDDVFVKVASGGFKYLGVECNVLRLTGPLVVMFEQSHQVVIRTAVECREVA